MTLKAEESYGYDYWFTPEAIYRVTIISYPFVFALFIGVYLLVGVATLFLPLALSLISFIACPILSIVVVRSKLALNSVTRRS